MYYFKLKPILYLRLVVWQLKSVFYHYYYYY